MECINVNHKDTAILPSDPSWGFINCYCHQKKTRIPFSNYEVIGQSIPLIEFCLISYNFPINQLHSWKEGTISLPYPRTVTFNDYVLRTSDFVFGLLPLIISIFALVQSILISFQLITQIIHLFYLAHSNLWRLSWMIDSFIIHLTQVACLDIHMSSYFVLK